MPEKGQQGAVSQESTISPVSANMSNVGPFLALYSLNSEGENPE